MQLYVVFKHYGDVSALAEFDLGTFHSRNIYRVSENNRSTLARVIKGSQNNQTYVLLLEYLVRPKKLIFLPRCNRST
jgi:hypothetical protein